MKICWDNIENIKLTKKGNFRDVVKKRTYHYKEKCKQCGEPFLSYVNSEYCSTECSSKYLSESRMGENNPFYGKKHKDETIQRMIEVKMGENNPFWKGGYKSRGIPIYNTFAPQLEWCEEVRRSPTDENILEVRCFKCNKWYIPTYINVQNKIAYLKGRRDSHGSNNFYCSDECKRTCSIYGKKTKIIIMEDAIRAGRLPWSELGREVQPDLRKMVLERDGYLCQKCGTLKDLQCHHIYPVSMYPLESADVDNCIILCYNCHSRIHREVDGCKPNQLITEVCI